MSARAYDIRREPAWLAPVAIAFGLVAMASRTMSYEAIPTTVVVGIAGALGARAMRTARAPRAAWLGAFALGVAVFFAARLLQSPFGPRVTSLDLVSITIAAVCEEAFFRGLLFGWFNERWGPTAACVASAALFALVHQPTYGWGAMPIDLAAGSVLAWQRHVTGGWSAPAATHVIANLLQVG